MSEAVSSVVHSLMVAVTGMGEAFVGSLAVVDSVISGGSESCVTARGRLGKLALPAPSTATAAAMATVTTP